MKFATHKKKHIKYCEKHDSNYCKKCDEWLEIACGRDGCIYCSTRPAKPSEAKDERT